MQGQRPTGSKIAALLGEKPRINMGKYLVSFREAILALAEEKMVEQGAFDSINDFQRARTIAGYQSGLQSKAVIEAFKKIPGEVRKITVSQRGFHLLQTLLGILGKFTTRPVTLFEQPALECEDFFRENFRVQPSEIIFVLKRAFREIEQERPRAEGGEVLELDKFRKK